MRAGNASDDMASAAADKLARRHEALRGIRALLSESEWSGHGDRLEWIATLIKGAG